MITSEKLEELATALAKAQAKIEGAHKDAVNPHFKSRYADLASVWDACRKPLTDNGLSIVQGLSSDEAKIKCTTMLLHTSGQFIKSELTMTPTQNTPQAAGSCATYLRRYSLQAMVGVAPDDDDGQAASLPKPQPPIRGGTNDRITTPVATAKAPDVLSKGEASNNVASPYEKFDAGNKKHTDEVYAFLIKQKNTSHFDKLIKQLVGKDFRRSVIQQEWDKINPEAPDKEPF